MAFSQYGEWQRSTGRLDDPINIDGDGGFIGLDSYTEPSSLKKGFVKTSENMRFDGGKASTRKGIEFKTGSGVAHTYYPEYDEVFAATLITNASDNDVDWVILAMRTKAILWNRNSELGELLCEDGASLTTEDDSFLALNSNEVATQYYFITQASSTWSTSTEKVTSSSHKFQTGDAVEVSTTGALPTPIKARTIYSVIDSGTNDIQLATTLALAKAGTAINVSNVGSGDHTIQSVVSNAAITALVASGAVDTSANTFTQTAHGFTDNDGVYLDSTGTLPTASGNVLSKTTKYYVVNSAANTFKLSELSGGSAMGITDAGSGTHTIRSAADTMKPSILQGNNKVLIFRNGARPLEWDGNFTSSVTGGLTDSVFYPKTTTGTSVHACPETGWGVFFRNRLIVPTADTLDSGVVNNSQTIVMSDILDDNEFVVDGEFYVNKGMADYVVGAIPYQEDQLIVFNRRSIHMVTGIRNTSTAAQAEVTRQFGCVSRKSIAQSGPNTYFLSDNGIYSLEPGVDPAKGDAIAISKVAPFTVPLSRPINDVIGEVNFEREVIERASAICHNNRYYISLPMQSDTECTIVLVYDFLLDAWVSKDTFPADFIIDGFVESSFGADMGQRRLFVYNDKGLWLYEESQQDESTRIIGTDTTEQTPIAGKLITRNYTLSNIGVKRFMTGQVASDVSSGDVFTLIGHTSDPDTSTEAITITGTSDEGVLTRFGIRNRGYAASVEINVTSGRPTFKHVVVESASLTLGARAEGIE